jgi:hypothetical protein
MAIRDFRPIEPVDFKTPALMLGNVGDQFNSGFNALNKAIEGQQSRYNFGFDKAVNANDLAIKANLQKFNELSALKQAKDAGSFNLGTLTSQYGQRYSQGQIQGLVDAREKELSTKLVNDRVSSTLDKAWEAQGLTPEIRNAAIEGVPTAFRKQVNDGVISEWNNRTKLTDKQDHDYQVRIGQDTQKRSMLDQQLSSEIATVQAALDKVPGFNAGEINWGAANKGDLESVTSLIKNDPERSWLRRFGYGDSIEDVAKMEQEFVTTFGGDKNLASAALMQAYNDSRAQNSAWGILGGGTKINKEDIRKQGKAYLNNWKRGNALSQQLGEAQAQRMNKLSEFDLRKSMEQEGYRNSFTFGSPKNLVALDQATQKELYGQSDDPTVAAKQALSAPPKVTPDVSPVAARLKSLEHQVASGTTSAQEQNLREAIVNIPNNTLAYRNNNPGNLLFAKQRGATKGERGFAKFDSPEKGYEALGNQISLDSLRGKTLNAFINKYAPPSENDTGKYLAFITKKLGVPAATKLKDMDHDLLVEAMAQMESGTKVAKRK